MIHPTRPDQRCRIVGSWSTDDPGKVGPNHNAIVTTTFLHTLQADDRVPVWRVHSETPLVTSMGVLTNDLDCLNYWLEVIDEEPAPPAALQVEKEKETT